MDSIWLDTAQHPQFEALQQDVKTDVLIIGGGLTGLLCAYLLQQAGVDYLLVEADKICSGITGNTTAKITLQHGLIYDKLISRFGLETAQLYLQANKEALAQYEHLCLKLDCDFQPQDSFVYSLDSREVIEREAAAFDKIGFPARFCSELPLPFAVAGAVQIKDQAQFNPLKFAFSLAEGLNICEQTKVLELAPGVAVTGKGKIRAEKMIMATHFPFLNKHGAYFLKLYQHRSYVLALKNAVDVQGMYVDESAKGLSFRNYGDLLLLGGGSHRTGKNGGNWQELSVLSRNYYPKAQEAARWATQDCMSLDGIPYIGQYSARTSGLYVATGFNKWGMSSAMVAAMLLTDLLLDRDNPYQQVFSPSRSLLHPQLALNAVESVLGLLTPTTPRCPHMGCALKYNAEEHSWDCPCHGSRFTMAGELIDNPATDDKKGVSV